MLIIKMTNYYKQFKRDVVKDIISLILIGLTFIGFVVGMVYMFK